MNEDLLLPTLKDLAVSCGATVIPLEHYQIGHEEVKFTLPQLREFVELTAPDWAPETKPLTGLSVRDMETLATMCGGRVTLPADADVAVLGLFLSPIAAKMLVKYLRRIAAKAIWVRTEHICTRYANTAFNNSARNAAIEIREAIRANQPK